MLLSYKINSYLWHKIVVNKIDTVVSISKFIKQEVEKTGRKSPKDLVIYNLPPHRTNKNKYDINRNSSALTIGYIGQIRELKGVHILIEAIISFIGQGYDIQLIVAGDTNLYPDYYNSINTLIQEKSLQKKFIFLGEIDNITPFFEAIDILCVPTIWPEALGNVLVEAKINHKPIIIFPSGGMPELINHKIDGFICKDKSVESLIEAFLYYFKNPPEIKTQGANSYQSLQRLGIQQDKFENNWKAIFSR